MFKYYLNKDYRRAYDDLEGLGLLSDSLAIKFNAYENYARELLLANGCITRHLQILTANKPSPLKVVKALLFVHAWLQTTPTFDQPQPFYAYMDHLLRTAAELGQRAKGERDSFERRRTKSAILKPDFMNGEEIELTKEVFLLEKVVRPYVLYLQKLVSVFPFYSAVKKTLYRSLATAEIWILLNLFKCGYAVTMQLPTISNFIRKSFTPVAESLAEAFGIDFNNFYPKLSHYMREECLRIQARYDDLERKFGEAEALRAEIVGLEEAVNLMQDIKQLNSELGAVYSDPSLARITIYRPKLATLQEEIFEFIIYLHHVRTASVLPEATPKFYRSHSSRPSEQTEPDKAENRPELVPAFRDISNDEDNVCTFRKGHTHIIPRYRKKEEENAE